MAKHKRSSRKSSGLTKFRSFVNKKTKGISKQVKAAEMRLNALKRKKASKVKEATRSYRKQAKR